MEGLVDADLAAAGERDGDEAPPGFVVDLGDVDAAVLHGGGEGVDVVAEEVDLVEVVGLGGVDGDLGGGQAEDEPSGADVDAREVEGVAEEGAVGVGVAAVEDDVGSGDQGGVAGGVGGQRSRVRAR